MHDVCKCVTVMCVVYSLMFIDTAYNNTGGYIYIYIERERENHMANEDTHMFARQSYTAHVYTKHMCCGADQHVVCLDHGSHVSPYHTCCCSCCCSSFSSFLVFCFQFEFFLIYFVVVVVYMSIHLHTPHHLHPPTHTNTPTPHPPGNLPLALVCL